MRQRRATREHGTGSRSRASSSTWPGSRRACRSALIADELDIPRSACHRLLARAAATRLRAPGARARRLRADDQAGVARPRLPQQRRASSTSPSRCSSGWPKQSGELVRLAIVDGDRLTWVAKAQGARKGLRYDPDMGMDARLSCTASGHAWLLTLSRRTRARAGVAPGLRRAEGLRAEGADDGARRCSALLHAARARGFAMIDEVFAPGMTAMAAPVQQRGQPAIGVISIAGPRTRLERRAHAIAGAGAAVAAAELAATSNVSNLFGRPALGKG